MNSTLVLLGIGIVALGLPTCMFNGYVGLYLIGFGIVTTIAGAVLNE